MSLIGTMVRIKGSDKEWRIVAEDTAGRHPNTAYKYWDYIVVFGNEEKKITKEEIKE